MFKRDLDEYIAVFFFFGVPICVFCAIAYLFSIAHAVALLLTLFMFMLII
jgi:hypothetical protein